MDRPRILLNAIGHNVCCWPNPAVEISLTRSRSRKVTDCHDRQHFVDVLRQRVGTVLQDDVLFAGSIAENISFFDPHPDLDWIAECAGMASIAAEIAAMPMGYNTLVGDMGTVLSGGEKQRILLARALYKRPFFLILDEATSHLDIDKEERVNTAIRSLDITRIIVAHRPKTIASADRVIVLADGKIVQDESIWHSPGTPMRQQT